MELRGVQTHIGWNGGRGGGMGYLQDGTGGGCNIPLGWNGGGGGGGGYLREQIRYTSYWPHEDKLGDGKKNRKPTPLTQREQVTILQSLKSQTTQGRPSFPSCTASA